MPLPTLDKLKKHRAGLQTQLEQTKAQANALAGAVQVYDQLIADAEKPDEPEKPADGETPPAPTAESEKKADAD